ncbi:MAG: phage protein Gp36 family protein [Syntrophobacteraceae bacterium]
MPYCTIDDLKKEIDQEVLIDLTDDPVNPLGVIGEANANSAIIRASAVMDGYLAAVLSVPAAGTPTLTAICVDISMYTLFSRKENVPKNRGDRYGAALNFLKAVVENKASIGVGSETTSRYPICSAPEPDFPATVWETY